MRPFRFGVQLYRADSEKQWAATIQTAADLGYSSVVLADHLGGQFAPLVALATVADRMPSMRLGTLVLNSMMRHPVIVAKEATTLDLLTGGGRLELGVGAGWLTTDVERAGLNDLDAAARVRRLREYVQILRLFWTKEEFDFDGAFFNLRGVVGMPRPATPEPPILIGGGSRRVLELAGQLGAMAGLDVPHTSGVFQREAYLAGASTEAFARRAAWVRDAAAEQGRDVEIQMLILRDLALLSNNPNRAGALSAMWRAPLEALQASPAAFIGDVDDVCDRIVEWRERTGVSYYVIQDDAMREAAPVVERLAGR